MIFENNPRLKMIRNDTVTLLSMHFLYTTSTYFSIWHHKVDYPLLLQQTKMVAISTNLNISIVGGCLFTFKSCIKRDNGQDGI